MCYYRNKKAELREKITLLQHSKNRITEINNSIKIPIDELDSYFRKIDEKIEELLLSIKTLENKFENHEHH